MNRRYLLLVALVALVATAGCLGMGDDNGDIETDDNGVDDGNGDANGDDANGDDGNGDALPDGQSLIDALATDGPDLTDVTGTQVANTVMEGQEVTTTFAVWERPPGVFRQELIETEDHPGFDAIIRNETAVWQYNNETNRALTEPVDQTTAPQSDYEQLAEMVTEATTVRTESVANRETYVVEATIDAGFGGEMQLIYWLDQETNYPLRQAQQDPVTGSESTVTFEEVEFNQGIDDERFEFSPTDETLILTESDLEPQEFESPNVLANETDLSVIELETPDGFTEESVQYIRELSGDRALIEYPGDEGEELVLSITDPVTEGDAITEPDETLDIAGVEVAIHEQPPVQETQQPGTVAAVWELDGTQYVVSSTLSQDDVVSIVENTLEAHE